MVDFLDLKELVEDLRVKHPFWFHGAMVSATDIQIANAEQELGVKFPPEYYCFLKEYGGGHFAFTEVFSVDQDDRRNVVSYNQEWNCLAKGFLSFADDGCGGYYGFPVENGVCQSRIVYLDPDEDYGNGKLIDTEYENLFDYIAEVGLKV